jgi:hypothetical protein
MYSATFEHTKKMHDSSKINLCDTSAKRTDFSDLESLLKWLSYMRAFHKIKNIKVFKGHESERNEIYVEIPKW